MNDPSRLPARRNARSTAHLSYADHAFARFRHTRDPDALATVVQEAARPLFRAARSLARDQDSAEDLVQNTIVAAIVGAAGYDPEHPVVPWLLGILSNRARRQHRSARRTPDIARLRHEAVSPDPHDAVVHRELERAVGAAVATLSSRYRPILELHLGLGLTPLEIAGVLQRPRSTVRTQLARGLARLREILQRGPRSELEAS